MGMPDYRFDNEDNVTWLDPSPVNDQLYLRLPQIRWPYYWCIEVGKTSMYYGTKRRFLLLFSTSISWRNNAYINHKGEVTQAMLDEVEVRARELAQQVNPARDVLKQLRRAQIRSVSTVRVKED